MIIRLVLDVKIVPIVVLYCWICNAQMCVEGTPIHTYIHLSAITHTIYGDNEGYQTKYKGTYLTQNKIIINGKNNL